MTLSIKVSILISITNSRSQEIEDENGFCRKSEETVIYPPVNPREDQVDKNSGEEFALSVNNLVRSQLGAGSEIKLNPYNGGSAQ